MWRYYEMTCGEGSDRRDRAVSLRLSCSLLTCHTGYTVEVGSQFQTPSSGAILLFFETGSSTVPELGWLASDLESHLSLPPQLWISEYKAQFFYMGSGEIELRSCVEQTFYPLGHLPSSLCSHPRHRENKAVNKGWYGLQTLKRVRSQNKRMA